jgi:hypothetical protein
MTNETIAIYDHATGENIVREMTDEEKANRAADDARLKAKLEEESTAIAAAQAKLAALGLTADDLKALGLGNN